MLTKQQQYNQNLDRLAKAEIYFQTKFKNDTEDGQCWAVETFFKLIHDQEKLYKELRPTSSTHDLQYGFTDKSLTLQFDIEDSFENILERIDIVRSEGWRVDKLEYLKKSKIILIKLLR